MPGFYETIADRDHRGPLLAVWITGGEAAGTKALFSQDMGRYAEIFRDPGFPDEIADGIAGGFGVVVCDVNGLKHINDTYGHKAGDKYIRDACALVCELFQHSPVYRVGGDEFVVILSGRDFDRRGDILAELQRRSEGNIGTDNVVISAGVSDYRPGEDMEVHTVFHRADERMYANKQALKAMGARTR